MAQVRSATRSPARHRVGTDTDTIARLTDLVTRASWRLRRGSAKELEPFGITFAQARMLRTVASAPEPLRMADLAIALDVVPRSATSMVDALEAAGMVVRRPDPKDRRSVRVAATVRGRSLVDRMRARRLAKADELFGNLGAGEQRDLVRLLATVLDEEAPR
jgi:DNA-binding MarR family transcriptional regulator